MKKIIFALCLVAPVFLFTGCATITKMPALDKVGASVETAPPIYLLTVTIKNNYHPRYQPKLIVTYVEKPGASQKADRFNFKPDDASKNETDTPAEGNSYTLRLQMPPGDYVLMGFGLLSHKFPFNGFGVAPLLSPLPSQKSGVFYVGHINVTLRERVGNEFRAGAVIPLLDQSMTGFSGGTYDISVEDRWAKEEAEFRAKFPGLQGVEIKKTILPPFDRAKAQKWWEDLPM